MKISVEDYLSEIFKTVSRFKPFIVLYSIEHQRRSDTRHVIRGRITFRDGSKLDFLEYIVIKDRKVTRISYRYNFRDSRGKLIFRYDNAPHYPNLSTFPRHKHLSNGRVVESEEPSLPNVLKEIISIVFVH